jgi:hypothetical protein|nr:MAG TPA: hypothetical protein [Caudoviricetes sp.]
MEVYRNNIGQLLKVIRAQNGRIITICGKETKCGKETESFENEKQFNVHLYNKGFHLAMTDRATLFARRYEEAGDLSTFIDMIPNKELAFQKDGAIYTCWFLAFKPNGMVEVKANTDFSYTNELGYKAVTLNISDLIVIQGDI